MSRTPLFRRPITGLFCATTFSFLAISPAARADCDNENRLSTCIDADVLWPHPGPTRFQSLGSTETTTPGEFSMGLMTSYLRKPILFRAASAHPDGVDVPAIDHMISSNFLWAFGLTQNLEVTLAMPVTLYQNGKGLTSFTSSQSQDIPTSSIRDFRLGAAYTLLPRRPGSNDGFALTERLEVALPTGDEQWFGGDKGAVVIPSLASDFRWGSLLIGAEAGARIRQVSSLAGTRMGSQLVFGLGTAYDILPKERFTASLETFALPVLTHQEEISRDPITQRITGKKISKTLVPAEWMLSLRSAPTADRDISFSLSVGTALPLSDSAVTSPQYRITAGIRFAAPQAPSSAHNEGISENFEQKAHENLENTSPPQNDLTTELHPLETQDLTPVDSPTQVEEVNPDADRDGDGIPDVLDKCPTEPETINGLDDEDGCPEPGTEDLTLLDGTRLTVKNPERFPHGSARISPLLLKRLRMMAQRARGVQPLELVLVETYADSQIATEQNENLASDRADAIRDVLLQAGIPSDKLTVAVGELTTQRPAQTPQFDMTVQRAKTP